MSETLALVILGVAAMVCITVMYVAAIGKRAPRRVPPRERREVRWEYKGGPE